MKLYYGKLVMYSYNMFLGLDTLSRPDFILFFLNLFALEILGNTSYTLDSSFLDNLAHNSPTMGSENTQVSQKTSICKHPTHQWDLYELQSCDCTDSIHDYNMRFVYKNKPDSFSAHCPLRKETWDCGHLCRLQSKKQKNSKIY